MDDNFVMRFLKRVEFSDTITFNNCVQFSSSGRINSSNGCQRGILKLLIYFEFLFKSFEQKEVKQEAEIVISVYDHRYNHLVDV